MDNINIRKAAAKDLPTLLEFEQKIIETERPWDPTLKDDPINYYNLAEMIEANDVEVAVVELDNKIIGSGYAKIRVSQPYIKNEKHAYLGFMYVVPEHRGKGINQKMVEFLKRWVTSQNITELRLDVYAENTPAIKAYEKCGFSKHLLEMRVSIE